MHILLLRRVFKSIASVEYAEIVRILNISLTEIQRHCIFLSQEMQCI